MYDQIIKLVKEVNTTDQYGDLIPTRTSREVFAECRSITQSEFYQANASGFKPEIKFVLADFLDYEGEKIVKYKPYGGTEEEYRVIRTYRANNELELVCKRGVDE